MSKKEIWAKCDCCDEFLCSIHGDHAHDCDCPGIDKWAETEWNPYFDTPSDEIIAWVEANPFDDE